MFAYRHFKWHYSSPSEFNDKTILITGASSGIGEELTKQMCRLGAKKIIIAARRIDELERVKKECSRPDII
jgi:NADP-dependent 3-hydroxy acid dehydrogenase YdfG